MFGRYCLCIPMIGKEGELLKDDENETKQMSMRIEEKQNTRDDGYQWIIQGVDNDGENVFGTKR